MKTRLFVYTDGAARGNPGLAGAGVAIKDETGKIICSLSKFLGNKTNNEAEYAAVNLAVDWLSQNLPKTKEIQFFFDSRLLVNQLSGHWRVKAPHLKPIVANLRLKIAGLGKKVLFNHLPREENSLADGLANLAIDEIAGG